MKLSKLIGAIAIVYISCSASYADPGVYAKAYNISVKDGYDTRGCAGDISALKGTKIYQIHEFIGVVSAWVTDKALSKVSRLSCVLAVEEDGSVGPYPVIGGGN